MLDHPDQPPLPERIYFSGLDGQRSQYCIAPQTFETLPGCFPLPRQGAPKIVTARVDPLQLAEAGWGVVWAPGTAEAVRQALAPLLEWRQGLAGSLFRQFEFFSGENFFDFLERHDAGPDSVNPAKVPYYLLLVGSPETLPFEVQNALAVSRAVGRLTFASTEGYADYARRLVGYEQDGAPSHRRAAFWAPESPGDPPTLSSVENFVKPLEQMVAGVRRTWRVETYLRNAATKQRLGDLLFGGRQPAMLFTAGHAVRYRLNSSKQPTHQGALVGAEWPGPIHEECAMRNEYLFSALDVPVGADLAGLIAFLFGCYTAGTPRTESYGFEKGKALATAPFLSPLPRTLLRRGALAVIGHVDLALEQSFLWQDAGPQLEAYFSVVHEVTAGWPVGHAFRHLSQRHAQLAIHAAGAARRAVRALEEAPEGNVADVMKDFRLWAAYEDARNYLLLGDPAARLHLGPGSNSDTL